MEFNQVAHDLAILYMQLEIKEDKILAEPQGDLEGFAGEYRYLYEKFSQIIDK